MSVEQFASLPATITVHELRYQIRRQGFRTQSVTLATTLLETEADPL